MKNLLLNVVFVGTAISGCKTTGPNSSEAFSGYSGSGGNSSVPIENGCFTLFDPHPVSPARKGQLCMYAWLGEVGSPGGIKVAYIAVHYVPNSGQDVSKYILFCADATQKSDVPATSDLTLEATKDGKVSAIVFNGNKDQGSLTLGASKYTYENANVSFPQLQEIFGSAPCR